ncbi:MAG TPA: tetratricopeptide repeat protein [Candidatus Eisenbacteria bacterium]|nr:tetratricopeptide repeat protein [Candidatus Eisenbacteria bacterium]
MPGPHGLAHPRPPALPWLAPLLFLGIAFLTYARALGSSWLWDDDANVTACAPVLAWSGLSSIWLDPHAIQQYYPILHTVFWLEHKLWGLNPIGFHAVNILLHALNAFLFWRLLVQLRLPNRAAWVGALLFVVHPVHVESVAWITEMKNTLSLAFALASALAWLRWAGLTEDASRAGRTGQLVISYVWFAMALLSKSVTVTVPVALLIISWWKRGRWDRRDWALAPLMVAAAFFALLTIHLESENVGTSRLPLELTLAQRVLLAGRALWFYASKLALPIDLSFVYPRWQLDPGSWWMWLFPLGAVGVLAALLLLHRRIGRGPAAAVLIWSAMLGPMLGFFDIFWFRYGDVSDHFQYHASLAPLAMAGLGLAMLAVTLERFWKRAGIVLVAAILSTLLALSWERVRVFRDSRTLWTETVRRNPEAWLAWNNLGRITLDDGRYEEAEPMLRRAIAIDAGQHEAWNNLGICLVHTGRPAEAQIAFAQAIELHPNDLAARGNLGRALLLSGDYAGAIAALEPVLAHPDHGADAEVDLIEALIRDRQMERAEATGRKSRFAGDPRVQVLVAITLRHRGALEQAITLLEKAAAQGQRRDPVVLDALATTLASANRFAEAVAVLEEALALQAGPSADAVLRKHLDLVRGGQVPR